MNGRDAFAWLTVKDTEEGLRIYSAELMDEKKLRDALAQIATKRVQEDTTTLSRSFDEIIARLNAPVKEQEQSSLYMSAADIARGFVTIANGQEYTIQLLKRANLSTILHETGHIALLEMNRLVTRAFLV